MPEALATSRRRQLRPDELLCALQDHGRGVPLPQLATRLHVTRSHLAQALVRAAWEHWCAALGLHPIPPCPPAF